MTHITIEREKLEQALEVLEENHHLIEEHERSEYLALYDRQITAIKQALAAHPPQRTEPAQQKKVWTFWDLSGGDIADAIKAKLKEKNQ